MAQQPPASDADRDLAATSLREDLTRERFYFVMADRFANGDPSNDRAGIAGDRLTHGYDPTATGFYHGGDLAGLLDQIDYIEGLGTTAIWLTPSFKNKPVRWLGERGLPRLLDHRLHPDRPAPRHQCRATATSRCCARPGHQGLLRHHHQPHSRRHRVRRDALQRRGQPPYVDKATEPYVTAAGVPFDDRDYADGDPAFPAVNLDSFPYTPLIPAGDEDAKVPDWLNDRRCTTTAAPAVPPVRTASTAISRPPARRLDDLWTSASTSSTG